jgi:hypothetical protein
MRKLLSDVIENVRMRRVVTALQLTSIDFRVPMKVLGFSGLVLVSFVLNDFNGITL